MTGEKILIIGCGGGGSWLTEFLARACWNLDVEITVMDFDTIEEKNILYSNLPYSLNSPKASTLVNAIKQEIGFSRSSVKIQSIEKKLESPYDLDPWSYNGIVVVATDDFMTRKIVQDYCDKWVDVRAEGRNYQIFTHKSKLAREFINQNDMTRGSCQNDPYRRVDMAHVVCAGIATQIILSILRGEDFKAEVFGGV